jgi:hypothetical protein
MFTELSKNPAKKRQKTVPAASGVQVGHVTTGSLIGQSSTLSPRSARTCTPSVPRSSACSAEPEWGDAIMKIKLGADIACPRCSFGKHREVRDRLAGDAFADQVRQIPKRHGG